MSTIKVSSSEQKQIWREDHPDYEVVDFDDWDDQGEYQYCYPVVRHIESGKFSTFTVQRSSSYFSDYDYDFPDAELSEVTKTIGTEEWEVVEDD